MAVFLQGLRIQYYRGIGNITQTMHPFRQLNFFIGANNSGKSTVLNFIARHLTGYGAGARKVIQLDAIEDHNGPIRGSVNVDFPIQLHEFIEVVISNIQHRAKVQSDVIDGISKICNFFSDGDVIWMKATTTQSQSLSFTKQMDVHQANALMPQRQWHEVWRVITNTSGGAFEQNWFPHTIAFIQSKLNIRLPSVGLIPAIREIGQKDEPYEDFSGRGLINILAMFQNPDFNRLQDRVVFDKVCNFLKSVTGEPSAQIKIPHDRKHILVEMNGKILPLSSLGTGIHEVIMIAAFCITSENMIICIEEPEIHLHPILQRKLLRELVEHTTNQYFIATHSASFIDTPDSAIFHVTNDGVSTSIRETILKRDQYRICLDLGYKASDILQSNTVVWVEGPSDRIYINHWITTRDSELIEGIHYTIMFYGGRLLSHLTGEDEYVSEFVNLMSLNRSSAIVIDSDKSSDTGDINTTKKRIQAEFYRSSGTVWITAGREIENYINYDVLHDAIKQIHPKIYGAPLRGSRYQHALHFRYIDDPSSKRKSRAAIAKDADKVRIAHAVCETEADFSILDLKDRISELVTFIRKANGLSV